MSSRGTTPPLPEGVTATELNSLANRLNSVSIRLLRSISEVDEVMGLTAPQSSLLSVLVFGGPQSIGQLARRERVSSPAITKHVDNLESLGLVERVRGVEDRRVVEVRATDAGRAVINKGRAARVRALAKKTAGFSPQERRLLGEALDLIDGVL
ncbi:MAG: MarR family transcriptional regulator [Acidimicrobiia bacterium]|nr:MarR family transcriptional regulator [Acidimicrobiia bacterium]